MGIIKESKIWLNISKSGNGVSIKIGDKWFICSAEKMKEWLTKKTKNDKGMYFGFSMNETDNIPQAVQEKLPVKK